MRGGIVGLVLVAPATGQPAEKLADDLHAQTFASEQTQEADLPPVEPVFAPDVTVDPFPGHTYGNLEDVACIVALENRHIAYERVHGHARGVQTPVRLMGPLQGVRFQHADTPDWLASARREILDCRLVLALDDFASVVSARGFTTVLHYGVYRGDLPLPKHGRPLHHTAALAIDVAAFVKDDGTRVEVRRDWRGHVGDPTCAGANAAGAREDTLALRGILCEVAREKLFHQVLTPNHNEQHKDHFHLEVMRDTDWSMVE